MGYLTVILPLKLAWEPIYRLPEGVETPAVGTRVGVVFARRDYVGVVSATEVTPGTDPARIQEILRIDTGLPPVTEKEIALWRQIADYYLCTVGEVYKVAYPPQKIALENAEVRRLQRKEAQVRKMRDALSERLTRFETLLAERQEKLARTREGTKAAETLRNGIARLEASIRLLHAQLDGEETLGMTGGNGLTPPPGNGPGGDTVPLPGLPAAADPALEKAMEDILNAFRARKTVLLEGPAEGMRSTLVPALAARALARGRSVLCLVPEIALGRRRESELREAFGERLLVFHSAETPARRREVARRVRAGGALVLGTRSAIFLPWTDLGLIVVEEEHEASYKQDAPAPRYQGRDSAILLGTLHRAAVLLCSGTPSLESLCNCLSGKYLRVRLPETDGAPGCARTLIIDTRAERRKRGMDGSFSRILTGHIRKVLASGGQVILLRGRKAYAASVQCEECGHVPLCPRCHLPLSLHKDGDQSRLHCHHCGHSQLLPETCPQCGKGPFKPIGAGTQRVEEEARELFPDKRIERLDADLSRAQEDNVLQRFAQGETDILIGTQILFKGACPGGVALVAVLQADSLLGSEDFRADERAAQALSLLRSRCGRPGREGLFVIQTAQPSHAVWQRFSADGADTLENTLLQERRLLHFPPWTRQTDLILRDANPTRLDSLARALVSALGRHCGQVTGPYRPAVDCVAGIHIRIIRVLMERDRSLGERKRNLAQAVARFEQERRYPGHITLDVDPA